MKRVRVDTELHKYGNKSKAALRQMTFPAEFSIQVDISKVNLDVIKPWVARRITQLLGGFEDDVLIGLVHSMLEEKELDPRSMQINLMGFLEKNTSLFMREMWGLLVSAQENYLGPGRPGIPQLFLVERAAQEAAKKAADEKLGADIAKRREAAAALRPPPPPPIPGEASGRRGDDRDRDRGDRGDRDRGRRDVRPMHRRDRESSPPRHDDDIRGKHRRSRFDDEEPPGPPPPPPPPPMPMPMPDSARDSAEAEAALRARALESRDRAAGGRRGETGGEHGRRR